MSRKTRYHGGAIREMMTVLDDLYQKELEKEDLTLTEGGSHSSSESSESIKDASLDENG